MAALAPATTEELSDPRTAAAIAEFERFDAERPLVEWHDGARFIDSQTGLTIDVVPGERSPLHYSETGEVPEDAPPLSRAWLNARARVFLTTHAGRAIEPFGERPTWQAASVATDAKGERRPRPDDAELVALVLAAYEAGDSPRQRLADEFGCPLNTADDWIKRARAVAPEYGKEIPAPTRGRGHKRPKGTNR